MKKIAFIILLTAGIFSSAYSFSQSETGIPQMPIDSITKLISYKEVVQEDGTPDELYKRAIEWINSFYKNPTGVTRTRDPINHKIIGVAQTKIKKTDKDGIVLDASNIAYTITIEFKKNRYRYELTKFNQKRTSHFPLERWLDLKDPQYNSNCPDYLNQVNSYALELIESLKKGMKPKVVIEDNW